MTGSADAMPATATAGPASSASLGSFERWWVDYWYEPMPRERLRVLSRVVHAVVLSSVTVLDDWVPPHGWAPRRFWQPIAAARWFHVPAPTVATMAGLRIALLAASIGAIAAARHGPTRAGATRRLVRAARGCNGLAFAGYALWLIWAFSWSKVDHDRLTILVALAVLVVVPAVGSGRDRAVGWAIRTVQVVFVLAYPLSAVSKIRKSGFGWASQATFARAIIRRGTSFGGWFLRHGRLLVVGQWVFVAFEVAATAALWRNSRVRAVVLSGVVMLHVFTWATIGIHFLPHTICLLSFLPLERLCRSHPADGAA